MFIRLRGSLFFRDPDTAMGPVFSKLDQLGIEPIGSGATTIPNEESDTIERIRRAADALRAAWQAEKINAQ